jgi:hypothetical protein
MCLIYTFKIKKIILVWVLFWLIYTYMNLYLKFTRKKRSYKDIKNLKLENNFNKLFYFVQFLLNFYPTRYKHMLSLYFISVLSLYGPGLMFISLSNEVVVWKKILFTKDIYYSEEYNYNDHTIFKSIFFLLL